MRTIKSLIIITLFTFYSGINSYSQNNVIDEVIAVVGDDAILKSDIEYQYQNAIMQGMSARGNLKCKLFEKALIDKLMLEQAKLDSIEVSENTVIAEADRRLNANINQSGGKEKLEKFFKKSIIQIKKQYVKLIREQQLITGFQRKLVGDIEITPSQVRAYYKKIDKDSLPKVPVQYQVEKIAIYPKIDQKDIDNVKARLRDFRKQVNEGRDFATLAVLYSQDPGSASAGGEMPWSPRGKFVPEFGNVAFDMQDKNKISKIVKTEYGYHIIQLLGRRGDLVHLRHILLKPEIKPEAHKKAIARLDTIAKYIKKDSISFENAALHYSMDKDTRTNGGLMINMRTQSSNFELSDFINPSLAKMLASLKEGEISKPFLMKDKNGMDVYVIIKNKKKIPPHRANIKDDYRLIQDIMTNQKQQEAINDWIIKKQKETYITIQEDWKKCDFKYKNWIK